MNWWRGKRPQDQAPEPEAHRDPENETAMSKQDPLLLLQRAAGNRAVQKLVPQSEGEPIAEGERHELESAFGQNLSEVRIHRDGEAGELAEAAGANAVTAGRDIYFAPGAYGASTLAHEVGHTIQQAQASSILPAEDASMEHQANAASSSFMSGHSAEISSSAAAPALQRQPAPGTQQSPIKLIPSDSVTLDAFDIDKFELSGTNRKKLDEFAKRLKSTLASAPDSIITIVGFADAPGTEEHNLGLGQQRADAVRDYLVASGISASHLNTASLGEGSPAKRSSGHEARNRRVEINVIDRAFFRSLVTPVPLAPVQAPPASKPKDIDLTYHPKDIDPQPAGEGVWDPKIDKAIQEAREAEKAHPGASASDLAGRVLRNAARKLGLPKWLQDRAESLGKDLPSKGAQAAVDEIAGDKSLDASSKNALKALVDALMHTKVR